MTAPPRRGLTAELLDAIDREADALWKAHRSRRDGAFHGFVPSDLHAVHATLATLVDRDHSFLELGAGAGAVTVVADLLGYEAWGIEIEPWLVEAAEGLAERFGSAARFIEGSFLPTGFDVSELIDPDFHVTYDDAGSAWDDAGLDLDDFDVVFAFPWPGEEALFDALLEGHARLGATFLSYHTGEGVRVRTL